jgi:tRNA-dihydrouridine synthase B
LGVPVTLKMRTGWSAEHKNALALALAAEQAGVQMLTIHGRTREQGYKGQAEYLTVAEVKSRVRIPVVVNGDIDSPQKARAVLDLTGADALMVGRAAQGRPWIFREIVHHLATGETLAPPLVAEVRRSLLAHLHEHCALYGEYTGVRTARKHLGWYVRDMPGGEAFREHINTLEDPQAQADALGLFLDQWAQTSDRMPAAMWDTAPATETQFA